MKGYIKYQGVDLECEYELEPYAPATELEPEEGSVELSAVYVGDQDITALLSDDVLNEIADKIWEEER